MQLCCVEEVQLELHRILRILLDTLLEMFRVAMLSPPIYAV